MFFKLQKFIILAFFIIFLPRDTWGNGGNPPGKRCYHAYNGCSLKELIKSYFPNSPNPHKELSFRDAHNRGPYKFRQLATYIDNDVSDFSWDKVLFIGGGSYKPGMVWYGSCADISKWKEGAHFTAVEPKKGRFVATIAHWPFQTGKHPSNSANDQNAVLWLIVKTKGSPVPKSWLKEPNKHKNKRYMAHMIYSWRRSPPNCPALGGAIRVNKRKHSGECRFPRPKLSDKEGEARWQGMATQKILNALGFNHDMRIPPMQGFIPQGGEVVGFLMAGYHTKMGVHSGFAGETPSIEEKTNIVWYKLPSRDGKIKGGVVGCHSDIGASCVPVTASVSPNDKKLDGKSEEKEKMTPTAETPTALKEAKTTPSKDALSSVSCRGLNTQIYVLRKQLVEHLKSYKGKRVKKWFGLKRDSCNNVKMKDREKFERCRGLASSIHNTREDLNANIREYNKRCRNR